jgi:hypothetical protein
LSLNQRNGASLFMACNGNSQGVISDKAAYRDYRQISGKA